MSLYRHEAGLTVEWIIPVWDLCSVIVAFNLFTFRYKTYCVFKWKRVGCLNGLINTSIVVSVLPMRSLNKIVPCYVLYESKIETQSIVRSNKRQDFPGQMRHFPKIVIICIALIPNWSRTSKFWPNSAKLHLVSKKFTIALVYEPYLSQIGILLYMYVLPSVNVVLHYIYTKACTTII